MGQVITAIGIIRDMPDGDETHFCSVPLPRKTPSGGCRYRTRRNVRSPSPKIHIAAVRKERYVVVRQPMVADDHRPIGEPGGDKLPRQAIAC
jgi:hypothetical protein